MVACSIGWILLFTGYLFASMLLLTRDIFDVQQSHRLWHVALRMAVAFLGGVGLTCLVWYGSYSVFGFPPFLAVFAEVSGAIAVLLISCLLLATKTLRAQRKWRLVIAYAAWASFSIIPLNVLYWGITVLDAVYTKGTLGQYGPTSASSVNITSTDSTGTSSTEPKLNYQLAHFQWSTIVASILYSLVGALWIGLSKKLINTFVRKIPSIANDPSGATQLRWNLVRFMLLMVSSNHYAYLIVIVGTPLRLVRL
jgi:hypothetical protein